jgi:HlyD family secretion protein
MEFMNVNRIFPFSLLALIPIWLGGCSGDTTGIYQGYIEGEYVYVASPISGALTNLMVARGDDVKAGEPLFELERQSEAASLAMAEKALDQTRVNLQLAETTYQRRKELRNTPSGVVSAEEFDQAKSQRDAITVQVAADEAALTRAQWSYDQKAQYAPTNAQVHDTLYRRGEYVMAGNPVVVLLPPENLKVRFFVPQADLPQVKIGGTATVTFDGGAHPMTATVNYISTQAEYTPPVIYSRETRANLVFMIEAKFPAADAPDLRPGQPVEVRLSSAAGK